MRPLFFKTPADLRAWLEHNHDKAEVQWIGYYKVKSGNPSITWPESVEQALCFGWIDGLRKSIDDTSYMIRFTPRKRKSHWSAVNIQKFEELQELGLITPAGHEAFDRREESNSRRASFEQGKVSLGKAFEKQFKTHPAAWEFFKSLPPSVKKPSIWWVISAKREETRQKRLGILIECAAEGKKVPPLRRKNEK